MRTKYFANYSVNNGSEFNSRPYEATNLAELKKQMKGIVEGSVFPGNSGSYEIFRELTEKEQSEFVGPVKGVCVESMTYDRRWVRNEERIGEYI